MATQYTTEDFLGVLDQHIPSTIAYIYRKVGCARDIAKIHIAELERTRQITRIEIRGGSPAWVKT